VHLENEYARPELPYSGSYQRSALSGQCVFAKKLTMIETDGVPTILFKILGYRHLYVLANFDSRSMALISCSSQRDRILELPRSR
jgi:hypothetical protein